MIFFFNLNFVKPTFPLILLLLLFIHLTKSQAVVADKTIYASGCIGVSLETGQLVSDDAAKQTEAALNHLKNILRAAGSNLNNVLKTTVYIQDFNDFATINEAYKNGWNKVLCR